MNTSLKMISHNRKDHKITGDSLLVKGFEVSLFPWKYADTLNIIRLAPDRLILMDTAFTLSRNKK